MFYPFQSLNILADGFGVGFMIFVALTFSKKNQIDLCYVLNGVFSGIGEAVVGGIVGMEVIDDNVLLQILFWLGLFLMTIVVRLIFCWIAAEAYVKLSKRVKKAKKRAAGLSSV